jgi:hypothetical protein
MNLTEIQEYFRTSEGYFYRVLTSKSNVDLLNDLNTIVNTIETGGVVYIRTINQIVHPDYQPITE